MTVSCPNIDIQVLNFIMSITDHNCQALLKTENDKE